MGRLDDQSSRIIVSEGNDFIWPGPDLGATAYDPDLNAHGILPRGPFARVRQLFLDLHLQGVVTPLKWTE